MSTVRSFWRTELCLGLKDVDAILLNLELAL
jgi:hypothetical protein